MEQEITEGSRLACSEAPGASSCLARHRGEWVQWAQKHTTGVYIKLHLLPHFYLPFYTAAGWSVGPGQTDRLSARCAEMRSHSHSLGDMSGVAPVVFG